MLAALLIAAAAGAPDTLLATFDGAMGTTYKWSDMNDPVMGGASTSSAQNRFSN